MVFVFVKNTIRKLHNGKFFRNLDHNLCLDEDRIIDMNFANSTNCEDNSIDYVEPEDLEVILHDYLNSNLSSPYVTMKRITEVEVMLGNEFLKRSCYHNLEVKKKC